MSHTKNKSGFPRFQVGNNVRVKYGVIVPDFPDIPLGGWTGTVTEIIKDHGQINCVFKLDLTFRTSALDYPRISFGAKLRGAVRYRRSSARWLDAVTERQLP